jgi:hypothetical protein
MYLRLPATCLRAGTSDRVLLLSGSLHSVLTAIFLILEKIARDAAAGKSSGPSSSSGSARPPARDASEREDEVRV